MSLLPAFRSAAALLLVLALPLAACGRAHSEQEPTPAPEPKIDRPEAAAAPARPPAAPPTRIFYIGHSLFSDVPDLVTHLAGGSSQAPPWKEQFIPGAPLRWQWGEKERSEAPGYHSPFEPQFRQGWFTALPGGRYDALVVVDSVPRGGPETEAETVDYLARFAGVAREAVPQARVLIMEPWHCLDSGSAAGCPYDTFSPTRNLPWRKRLDADAPMWERIVGAASQRAPGLGPIELIPAGRALGLLTDAIERGEVPGLSGIRDLFEDDIHLDNRGRYFVALIVHGALYGNIAAGRPVDARNRWGAPYFAGEGRRLTPEMRTAFERVAAAALGL